MNLRTCRLALLPHLGALAFVLASVWLDAQPQASEAHGTTAAPRR
jgi:hypothetical protein